ncbi:NPCBM/NEW2 domain-containing protein [Actinomadura rugatobispora]|uniref:NPCBM/NEW2 domain-containing protein n=1 Tax=Actinomadura rugatobispora TaxID=1994 RepID=A0ABW0ZUZ4_9ACTN|nr:hypothetical protein GCM10010200_024800 [Actinomadura rugatobispora]
MVSFDKDEQGSASRRDRRRRRRIDLMLVLTALAVLVTLGAWLFPRDKGPVWLLGRDPATPATPAPATPATPATPPSVPPPTATATPSPTPVADWLVDMEPVDDSSDVDPEPVTMGGVDYPRSLRHECSLFCNDDGKGVEVYYLGGRYKKFEAMIGVNDRAEEEQVGLFQVTLDGRHQPGTKVSTGHPKKISIDVTGVLRLRLEAFRPGTTDDPAMAGARAAGGRSNLLPDLAWGDPRVSQ